VLITFDTGIYVSAMQFGGTPKEAIVLAVLMDTIVFCDQLADEVVRVMQNKFELSSEKTESRLASYLSEAICISVTGKVSGICRDPKDDFILECAQTGNADLIVTGDKDLLSLKLFNGIQIVTPRQYLNFPRR
jgi:putative PIN family toxin of toxin-antitoxin system